MGVLLMSGARGVPPSTYTPDWRVVTYAAPYGISPTGIAWTGGQHLYVSSRSAVYRVQWPAQVVDAQVLMDLLGGALGSDIRRIYFFDNRVWVLDRGLPGIRVFNADLSTQLAALPMGLAIPHSLGFRNDQHVWVSDSSGAIQLFSTDTYAHVRTAYLSRLSTITADLGAHVFAAALGGGDVVHVVDPLGNLVASFLGSSRSATPTRVGVSWDGFNVGRLVTASGEDGLVRNTNLVTGARTAFPVVSPSYAPYDSVELGAHVLISDGVGDQVARLTPVPGALEPLRVALNPGQMSGGFDKVFVANEGGNSYSVVT